METYIRRGVAPASQEDSDGLIERARDEAIKVLRRCSHRMGFKASARVSGYPHVWARDSMITLLGALFSDDPKVLRAAKASLATLRGKQTDLGLIPNYVDTRSRKPSYHIYADGGAWWVIGRAALFEVDDNLKSLREDWPSIEAVLHWYEYQDVDNSGLVAMQEAADWEDLFAVRGKGLTVNVLYCTALKKGAALARKLKKDTLVRRWSRKAAAVKRNMNERLWYAGDADPETLYLMYHGPWRSEIEKKRFRETVDRLVIPANEQLPDERYYLPYITHYDFGEWFDSFGNLLALLSGVADKERARDILHIIEDHDLAERGPIVTIYPSIKPGDSDWRDYYGNFNLNLPDQYHNGGIWPFIGGFYVAALVKAGHNKKAREQLAALAALNHKGREIEWEFNEWYHGKNGRPMGKEEQAWSAGGYLFAYECVRRRRVPWF
ncbi:MAG: glycoside hydrolase 100 family protein [Patescibacteria group bacterium]|nr:glycoside hydrolase 100 family protein [Patescibacteria group bacterium]